MSWLLWIVFAWLALGTLLTVALVGKEREPITPGTAVVSVIFLGIMGLLLIVGGGLL